MMKVLVKVRPELGPHQRYEACFCDLQGVPVPKLHELGPTPNSAIGSLWATHGPSVLSGYGVEYAADVQESMDAQRFGDPAKPEQPVQPSVIPASDHHDFARLLHRTYSENHTGQADAIIRAHWESMEDCPEPEDGDEYSRWMDMAEDVANEVGVHLTGSPVEGEGS